MKIFAIYDDSLLMKDAGLVAADAAATVKSKACVIDLGAGYFRGMVVIDVSAIETGSSDETYGICWQVSATTAFTSFEEPCNIMLGHATPLRSNVTSTATRYILFVHNEMQGTVYRYARLYTDVTGTIASGGGINYTAFLSKL